MSVRPKKLSKEPTPLDVEDPRGDVLADVLGATLLRNAMYRRIECGAPWGIEVPKLPRATFYLVARGTAVFALATGPATTLSAGDAVFVPHGAPHTLRDAPGSKTQLVCDGECSKAPAHGKPRRLGGAGADSSLVAGFFEFKGKAPALLAPMPEAVVLASSDPAYHRIVGPTVQLIVSESASREPGSALVLQRLADVLFVQMLRVLSEREESRGACEKAQRGLRALSDPAIHDALAILHARVGDAWTVEKLASRVGLSRSSFASRFTELVGEPPLQYLARWRMSRAAELLRDTGDRVNEIATSVGYESVPSFNKAFRKWQGQSPSAFRRSTTGARPPNGAGDTA
ncbi:MAG: AraC family transcriptional regulator [Polyangiaceae bacterium]